MTQRKTTKKQQRRPGSDYRNRHDAVTNQIDRAAREKHNRLHHALAGFDRRMAAAEARWGYERLPALVPADLAERFGSAMTKLDDAIEDGDPETVAKKAAVVMRGIDALEKWCDENGVTPDADPLVIATAHDGRRIGIAQDIGQAALHTGNVDFPVYSFEEVANIVLSHHTALVDRVKNAFPGAKVTAVRSEKELNGDDGFDFKRGDELPF